MTATVEDPIDEGNRLLDAAGAAAVELRLTGGVAIAKICPSAVSHPRLRREYSDIDFIGSSRASGEIEGFFAGIGYMPDAEFNSLHGEYRLFFTDSSRNREADVFLDEVRACHTLDLRDRLAVWETTLPPADLLLSKLQVVETNDKDFQDIFAILLDHPLSDDDAGVSVARITDICARDWGWWRTVTMVIEKSAGRAEEILESTEAQVVKGRLEELLAAIDDAPKSRRWKMRARVGERVPWHDDPEEIEHS